MSFSAPERMMIVKLGRVSGDSPFKNQERYTEDEGNS
jgi:hypothetical protein